MAGNCSSTTARDTPPRQRKSNKSVTNIVIWQFHLSFHYAMGKEETRELSHAEGEIGNEKARTMGILENWILFPSFSPFAVFSRQAIAVMNLSLGIILWNVLSIHFRMLFHHQPRKKVLFSPTRSLIAIIYISSCGSGKNWNYLFSRLHTYHRVPAAAADVIGHLVRSGIDLTVTAEKPLNYAIETDGNSLMGANTSDVNWKRWRFLRFWINSFMSGRWERITLWWCP